MEKTCEYYDNRQKKALARLRFLVLHENSAELFTYWKRIEKLLLSYTIVNLNWDKFFEHLNFEPLEPLIKWLNDFVMLYDED